MQPASFGVPIYPTDMKEVLEAVVRDFEKQEKERRRTALPYTVERASLITRSMDSASSVVTESLCKGTVEGGSQSNRTTRMIGSSQSTHKCIRCLSRQRLVSMIV